MSSLIATALLGFIALLFTLFVTMLLAIVGAILRALMGRLAAAAIVGGAACVIAALALNSLVNAAGAGLVAFLLALSGPTPRIGRLRSDDWPGGGFAVAVQVVMTSAKAVLAVVTASVAGTAASAGAERRADGDELAL